MNIYKVKVNNCSYYIDASKIWTAVHRGIEAHHYHSGREDKSKLLHTVNVEASMVKKDCNWEQWKELNLDKLP